MHTCLLCANWQPPILWQPAYGLTLPRYNRQIHALNQVDSQQSQSTLPTIQLPVRIINFRPGRTTPAQNEWISLGPVLKLQNHLHRSRNRVQRPVKRRRNWLRVALVISVFLSSLQANANTAFFYSTKPPLAELAAHTRVVLDPRLVTDEEVAKLRATGTDVHAYVSIGEIEPTDPLYTEVPGNAVLATNEGWNTSVIDLTNSAWRSLILDKRIAPLAQRGFNGLFLDTLDSYHLTAQIDQQKAALASLIGEIQTTSPELKLLLNRGFEVLDALPAKVTGVVAESLFKSFNPATEEYRDVPANDRDWLLARFEESRAYASELIAIDYLPTLNAEAKQTARKISALNITPWVTDPSLTNLGISNLVPVPRRVMVLHNDTGKKLAARDAHTLFGASLDWYGYVADFHNIRDGAPKLVSGVHRGTMMWLAPKETNAYPWFDSWLEEQATLAPERKLLFLGSWPSDSPQTLTAFGLKKIRADRSPKLTKVTHQSGLVGHFEAPVRLRKYEFGNIQSTLETNEVHLEVQLESGELAHQVITAPWGGLIHHPYLLDDYGAGQRRYITDPFKFIERALAHTPRPVLDTTTQNGKRLLTIHVDGDGFASRAFLPGAPLSGNVLLDQFIANTDLPHTISVIEGEVGKAGLYPKQHKEFEAVARRIFREPNVELASHSYSHPFYWQTALINGSDKAQYGLNLPIKNYAIDLNREIQGSVDYINTRLAPPGKKVKVFLWSGSADPDDEALRLVEEAGLVNVNGGNSLALDSTKTITSIWPQARRENGGIQIYAAIMNENVYTNDWEGPYYGFRKVIETFDVTNEPRRLKPLCIYYHFYSATKPAAIKALRDVYDAAIASNPFPMYLSEFAELVQSYYSTSLFKDLNGKWSVHNAGPLRTLRIPQSLGYPDQSSSTGLSGYNDANQDRYLHMSGPSASFDFVGQPPNNTQLASANARVVNWQPENANRIKLRLQGHTNIDFKVHSKSACNLTLPGSRSQRAKPNNNKVQFNLATRDTGDALLVCK